MTSNVWSLFCGTSSTESRLDKDASLAVPREFCPHEPISLVRRCITRGLRQQRGRYILKCAPANSYCPSQQQPLTALGVCRAHAEVSPSVRRHNRTVLPNRTGVAACAFPGPANYSPARASTGHSSSALSSWFCRRHHPVRHQRVSTALPRTSLRDCVSFHSRRRKLLLRPHSPATAF